MYTEYFGLSEAPFSIAPNPQYLYMSPRHRDALAHLLYGVQSDGGFILLTGEVGTGKTTLCRRLLSQIPEDVETAFVFNPRVTATELLATICDEFGVVYQDSASIKDLVDALNVYLLERHAQAKKAVLIIDEAQNLSRELLEQIRLLTNLETTERKLLQIILLGQPELLDMLARQDLRQFNQRITARFHLEGLNLEEVSQYISHRLEVAGGSPQLMDRGARRRVFRLSQGIPRVINLICDRALLGAYAEGKNQVRARIVSRAAKEVLGSTKQHRSIKAIGMAILGVCLLVATVAGVLVQFNGAQTSIAPTTEFNQNPSQFETFAKSTPKSQHSADELSPPSKSNPELSILPDDFGHKDIEQAYHDLFALWGAAFEDRVTPACKLSPNIGLGCHQLITSEAELMQLNRPVIIEYNSRYFTLSAIRDDKLVFISSDQEVTLNRSQFARVYHGRASLFWRMPPAFKGTIKAGDEGPSVDWLVIQLALIEGETPPLTTGLKFTGVLKEKVKQFQFSKGLPATGDVGVLTWIHLNSVEAVNTPLLKNTKPAQLEPGAG
ncbi:MAG: general secretion pathway protein A [Candidatus Azotimanducaceae bacterium]|jgi:general secretion pathway protein A